jgi:hypothetical protein
MTTAATTTTRPATTIAISGEGYEKSTTTDRACCFLHGEPSRESEGIHSQRRHLCCPARSHGTEFHSVG